MPAKFDLDAVPQKNDSTVLHRVKDEAYIIRKDTPEGGEEKLWILNTTALYLWERIDGQKNVREILDEFTERFDAEPPRIKEDFMRLLLELEEQQLLTLTSPRTKGKKHRH